MSELQAQYEKSYALVIGIDSYTVAPPLNTARYGAEAIASVLSEKYKFNEVLTLYDEEATKQNIEDVYSDLRARLRSDDRLVIYWAGHGVGIEGRVRPEGWLIAYDSDPALKKRLIRMRDLTDPNYTPAKHALVILDTCHSGFAVTYEAARAVTSTNDPRLALQHYMKRRAYQVLASANPLETATDAGMVNGHTPFTGYLLEALEGHESARNPVTGLITSASVSMYIQDRLSAYEGNWQGPQSGILPGDEGGMLIWELPNAADALPERLRRGLINDNPDTRYYALADAEGLLNDARYITALREVLREIAVNDTNPDVRGRAMDVLMRANTVQAPVPLAPEPTRVETPPPAAPQTRSTPPKSQPAPAKPKPKPAEVKPAPAPAGYTVMLNNINMNRKITTIKVVRDLTDLGLADAKYLVESLPQVIIEGVDLRTAQNAKALLEAEGAVVEIVGVSQHVVSSTQDAFLLAVEDVFFIKGQGVVVTGRVERGSVALNDRVEVVGGGPTRQTTIGSIEMFSKAMRQATAGDNAGLLLTGLERDQVERGMVIAAPGSIAPHETFMCDVYVLTVAEGAREPGIQTRFNKQVYVRTADYSGKITLPDGAKIAPNGETISGVMITLETPAALEVGQRFAIRDSGLTVGAGTITELLD